MSGLTALLGETLTGKDGPVQVSSLAKAGHVVGLYFSERGCSACQEFMPQLVAWYTDMRDGDVGTKLEIVYIGDDESQEEFDECYGEMPWTALPYGPTIKKMSMVRHFIYMYTYIYVHIYVHTHTHTHTHIYIYIYKYKHRYYSDMQH